jgi:hypothetical protein
MDEMNENAGATTTHAELAVKVLDGLREPPTEIPTIAMNETQKNNAARCMGHLFCNRLSSNGEAPERLKHTTYQWAGGLIALRNARITDHHWSTLQVGVAETLHHEAESQPVVYVLTYWAIVDGKLHAWAIPEDVAHVAFGDLPTGKDGTYKTVEVFPDTHTMKNAPNVPDLSSYYVQSELLHEEVSKLVEAIKMDHAAKRADQDLDGDAAEEESEGADEGVVPFFTTATVNFLKELPDHVQDAEWHEDQKLRYQRLLRDPARSLVEALRDKYIERLSPEVDCGVERTHVVGRVVPRRTRTVALGEAADGAGRSARNVKDLHCTAIRSILRATTNGTAAVLGELLQLLEYRGTTVRLLSGRRFVFPRNLFIIGTMNSADRSIGRMELALRRRFLWLNLHAQPEALQRWLDRLGNNPVGFKSFVLEDCNGLLAKRGIPPEQHIGHALFMVQESDADDETGVAQDIPLTENHLHRIVQFSVVPYVRELFATQFGQVDEELIGVIRGNLLSCLNKGDNKGDAAPDNA